MRTSLQIFTGSLGILAEVFRVRVSEVDEMIQNRYDVRYEENFTEDGDMWPREFQLEG